MAKHKFMRMFMLLSVIAVLVLSACGSNNSDSGNKNSGDSASKESTAWSEIKKAGTITVGTSGTLYPSSFHEEKSNKLTGYDVEVVREVAKRLDLDVKFKEMGFDAMLPSLKNSQIDIAANDIGETAKRKETFDFSDPYKYSFGTIIVRADGSSGVKKLEDLKGKRAGGAATSIYSQIAKKFGAEIVTYGNATNDAYLRDVDLGRTDVILNDYYLQKLALKAFPQFDLKIQPDIKFNLSHSSIVMKKGNSELQKKINGALADMKKDGTLKKLSEKFFNADVSVKPDMDIREVKLGQQ